MENKLERLETKIDKQAEDITQILVFAGRSDERLKTINGTLLRHNKSIECHRKKLNRFNYYLGLATGGILVVSVLINVIV